MGTVNVSISMFIFDDGHWIPRGNGTKTKRNVGRDEGESIGPK